MAEFASKDGRAIHATAGIHLFSRELCEISIEENRVYYKKHEFSGYCKRASDRVSIGQAARHRSSG